MAVSRWRHAHVSLRMLRVRGLVLLRCRFHQLWVPQNGWRSRISRHGRRSSYGIAVAHWRTCCRRMRADHDLARVPMICVQMRVLVHHRTVRIMLWRRTTSWPALARRRCGVVGVDWRRQRRRGSSAVCTCSIFKTPKLWLRNMVVLRMLVQFCTCNVYSLATIAILLF